MAEGDIKWFTEAKLNITKNCIDRHLNKEGIRQQLSLNHPLRKRYI
jgi:acyl-coenzyme A synthetase/AMP-(fatty) acid ligase